MVSCDLCELEFAFTVLTEFHRSFRSRAQGLILGLNTTFSMSLSPFNRVVERPRMTSGKLAPYCIKPIKVFVIIKWPTTAHTLSAHNDLWWWEMLKMMHHQSQDWAPTFWSVYFDIWVSLINILCYSLWPFCLNILFDYIITQPYQQVFLLFDVDIWKPPPNLHIKKRRLLQRIYKDSRSHWSVDRRPFQGKSPAE